MTKIGDVRVVERSEYEPGEPGFLIETFSYWNDTEPHWAIPAWDEWGHGDRVGPFPTRKSAQETIE